ncbi:hypothetical protein ILYODFUR_016796 [Ilyodon furcidens]|uniref:Uncharacterized protein n=1 Tax=Ilyodon furcidens TaxID=33524 RepID=A0ABV0UIW3_9TELE
MMEKSDQPDSVAQFLRVLSQQGILLGQHNSCLQTLQQQQAPTNSAVVELCRNIQTLQNQLSAGSSSQSTVPPPAACPNPVISPVRYQSISRGFSKQEIHSQVMRVKSPKTSAY